MGIDWFPDLAKLGLKDASDNSDNTNDYYNRLFYVTLVRFIGEEVLSLV